MRIGINLLFLLPGIVGGTETYAKGLIKGFSQINSNDEIFIFLNKESENWEIPKVQNLHPVICPINATNRYRRYFFEQFILPKYLISYNIDLIHSLGYVGPLFTRCPSIVTIHDAYFVILQKNLSFVKKIAFRLFCIASAKRSARIITISNFAKSELLAHIRVPSAKVEVIYLGFKEQNGHEISDSDGILNKYSITKPFIATFGGSFLHKNIPALIQAFISIKEKIRQNLVIIGHLPASVDKNLIFMNRDRLCATGYVPDEDLLPILRHADALVIPSLYEGFGLPVIEGMALGIPVICSNTSSLPEIANNAAVFFNPLATEDIAEKIESVVNDQGLMMELSIKGKKNAARFSWLNTANATLELYKLVIQQSKNSTPLISTPGKR